MAHNLFVGGLPYETTQEELAKMFAACGKVIDVKLIMDRDTGRSKGFAFVEMSTAAEAQAAIKTLNGSSLGQRQIFINEARPQEKRPEGFSAKPGFVERRSGKDRRRQPGGFGGEKKWADKAPAASERRESFGGEKKWAGKPGGFGGEKKWAGKPGGFGGEKKWGDKPPRTGEKREGFGGEKKWAGKPGGFGGKKKWAGKPGGFGGPKKWGGKKGA